MFRVIVCDKKESTPPPSHAQQLLDKAISALNETSEDNEIQGCLMILSARLYRLSPGKRTIAIMNLLNALSTFPEKK